MNTLSKLFENVDPGNESQNVNITVSDDPFNAVKIKMVIGKNTNI